MVPVALSLGSSLGNRLQYLQAAVAILSVQPELRLTRASRVSWTPPVGGVAKAPFLNAVLKAETTLSPEALLQCCKRTEEKLGRKPARRFAERCVDVDLLLYGSLRYESETLLLPHPRLQERDFFLDLLQEVWPDSGWPASKRAWPRVACLRLSR